MITVLHITPNLSRLSGVNRIIMNIYKRINRNKIKFIFLTFNKYYEDTYLEEIQELGGEVHYIEYPKAKDILKLNKKLKEYIEENFNNISVIHYHAISPFKLILKHAKKYDIPIITHAHATQYSDKKKNVMRNYILNHRINDLSDYRAACSRAAGDFLYKDFLESSNDIIINNAIDLKEFKYSLEWRQNLRRKHNVEEDEIIIGHVGRYSEQKNQLFLLDVFKQILKIKKNYKLLLIGTGKSADTELFKEIKKRQISSEVIVISHTENISKYYSMMDIFVLPSRFEGLPLVGVEAQATGINCIFSESITSEIVLQSNCKMLPLNEEIWVTSILETTEKDYNFNCRDSAYLNREMEDYDINITTKYIEKLYEKINNQTKAEN